jgi:hypothetical protein
VSFDLTGTAASAYLIRVCKDIVSRSQRFQKSLGDVSIATSNQITYGDVQILVKDVASDGSRQSPNYFMHTQTGRAILCQLADKEGAFFEWITEIDKTNQTPASGVYNFNVDSVDERTREVVFTMQKYRWVQGSVSNATGSVIGVASGFDLSTLVVTDPTTGDTPDFSISPGCINLLSPVGGIAIHTASGSALVPNTDYWVLRQTTTVLIQMTVFGSQTALIPSNYATVSLVDQTGYVLRPNIDWGFLSATTVELTSFTPSGATISIIGLAKLDPTVAANLINPENTLSITIGPGETLVANQFFVTTQTGVPIAATVNPDGTITLPTLLAPGSNIRYEARVQELPVTIMGKKMATNRSIIPGLSIAIGDNVSVNDQCAILVSPFQTQTYEVFGAKENVSFTILVKANDPTTTSDLAELIKHQLLIYRRGEIEVDGLTILSIARSSTGQQRDSSGTAPSYSTSLAVSSMADWRVFIPLITRVTNFAITPIPTTDFPGKVVPQPRYSCLQAGGFIPDYR